MNNVLRMLALAATLGLAFTATAQEKTKRAPKQSVHDQLSGQGYGVAGCGLGSMAFGPKPGMIQIIAATVNGTAGSQTFGITSGTSNCDIPESAQQAAVFIEVNKELVRKDAARGQGETVKALAEMLSCGSAADLGATLKNDYPLYFGQDVDTYETIRRLLKNGACNNNG